MRRLPLPEPLAAEVEVWRLDLDVHAPVPDADWAVLGGGECDRALRLHRQPEFLERWVVKEAVLKAIGLGVTEHLQHVSVCRPGQGDCRYGLQCSGAGWPLVGAWRLDAPPGYAAALAWTATATTSDLQ